MKRFISLLLFALIAIAGMAQTNPNRLIVVDKNGGYEGYVINRLDSIVFRTVSGEVKANVDFLGYEKNAQGNDVVKCNVTRTAACNGFKILVHPKSVIDQYKNDDALARYVDKNVQDTYYQDFANAELTGFDFELQANTAYSIVTVGIDEYGIASDVSRTDFTTPAANVVGNPSVTWEVIENTKNSFKLEVVPNADCAGYYVCRFDKGTAEEQFNTFGAWFGFANMGDMIKSWSRQKYTTQEVHEWTDCSPSTAYEVYILPVDVNDEYGSMVIAEVTTAGQGGTGTAEVTITIGDFGYELDDNGTKMYWQKVTYTPNDQTLLFRDMVITKEAYDNEFGDEGILNYLKEDKPYVGWDHYTTDEAQWNAEPNTDYIAFAIAKNANEEWGPLARKEFHTPAGTGVAPRFKSNNKLTLIQR